MNRHGKYWFGMVSVMVIVILGLAWSASLAQSPKTISYQGYLKDAVGTPVTTPTNLTFRLYSSTRAESGVLWSESKSVTPASGVYSVVLGTGTPLDTLPFDRQYFLGVTVGGGSELTPRQPLTAAPYAMRAAQSDSVATTSQIVSTVPSGTSPLQVSSMTMVPNLNADLLDNLHASDILITASDSCAAAVTSLTAQLTALQAQNAALLTQMSLLMSSSILQYHWGTAQLIEGDNTGNASFPQVAMDVVGNAMTVWQQSDGTRNSIWANRYVAGTGWGTPQIIETDTSPADFPQVAMDANGNAVAVWQQTVSGYSLIWANRYVAGSGWGTAQIVGPTTIGEARTPQVAMDPSGNAVVVWSKLDGTRYNIWANRYVVGGAWGTAQLIETNNTGDALDPQVAMDAGGNAVAVWVQYDGTVFNLWASRYGVGKGWSAPQLIETDNAGYVGYPQVAMDPSGNAMVVWDQSDGTLYRIWANRYVVGSGWGTAQLIETDNAGGATKPQVAMDAGGTALAVWEQYDGTRENIWANRYVAGTGWGTAQLIETDNAGYAQSPQVALETNGNAMAVWQQNDGTRNNIWANRYVVGSGWGMAQLIESDNAGAAQSPQVAVDTGGNAVAVWHQSDGIRNNIWANRFSR